MKAATPPWLEAIDLSAKHKEPATLASRACSLYRSSTEPRVPEGPHAWGLMFCDCYLEILHDFYHQSLYFVNGTQWYWGLGHPAHSGLASCSPGWVPG